MTLEGVVALGHPLVGQGTVGARGSVGSYLVYLLMGMACSGLTNTTEDTTDPSMIF
jgi:hypothetical protein